MTDVKALAAGIMVLQDVLKRARWDNQGGYPSYQGDGKWSFVTAGLPQASPAEWNALFKLAGIEPDVIVSIGSCHDCQHAKTLPDGRRVERAWAGQKCCSCGHPRMSNFEPLVAIQPTKRRA